MLDLTKTKFIANFICENYQKLKRFLNKSKHAKNDSERRGMHYWCLHELPNHVKWRIKKKHLAKFEQIYHGIILQILKKILLSFDLFYKL